MFSERFSIAQLVSKTFPEPLTCKKIPESLRFPLNTIRKNIIHFLAKLEFQESELIEKKNENLSDILDFLKNNYLLFNNERMNSKDKSLLTAFLNKVNTDQLDMTEEYSVNEETGEGLLISSFRNKTTKIGDNYSCLGAAHLFSTQKQMSLKTSFWAMDSRFSVFITSKKVDRDNLTEQSVDNPYFINKNTNEKNDTIISHQVSEKGDITSHANFQYNGDRIQTVTVSKYLGEMIDRNNITYHVYIQSDVDENSKTRKVQQNQTCNSPFGLNSFQN